MHEIRVAALGLVHLGSHVVVHLDQGVGPYAGMLIDVVHRPGGPSWLWFSGSSTAVVLVVEDPGRTAVRVDAEPEGRAPAVPRQRPPRRRRRRSGQDSTSTLEQAQGEPAGGPSRAGFDER